MSTTQIPPQVPPPPPLGSGRDASDLYDAKTWESAYRELHDAPALLIQENGGPIDGLALTMAAALHYRGPDENDLEKLLAEKSVGEAFAQISGCPVGSNLNLRVVHYFGQLKPGVALLKILDS